MEFRKIDVDNIRRLLELAELREAKIEEIRQLDAEIDRRSKLSRRSLRKYHRKLPKKAAPGALADAILRLLEAAGPNGTTVADISTALKKPAQNIRVWFSTTGKKNPRVVKLGESRFALQKRRPSK